MKLDQNSFMEDNREERFSPWCSYSDMFCSLLMIFILLFIFVMLQYVSAKANDAAETARVVQEQQSLAADAQVELEKAQQELIRREAEIANVDSINAALLQANQEKDLLTQQLLDLRADKDASDFMVSTYGMRIEQLSQDLETARIQLGTRNDELSSARIELEEGKQMLGTVQMQLQETEQALAEKELLLQQSVAEQKNTALDLQNCNDQIAVLSAEQQTLLNQIADLEIKNSSSQRENTALQERISGLEIEKNSAQEALNTALNEATVLREQVSDQQQKIDTVQALYNAQSAALNATSEELMSIKSTDLNALNAQILVLEQQLKERDQAFSQQESVLTEVAGIRIEIIGEIRDAMKASNIEARVDEETGAIVMSSELLFAVNQAELRPEGREFLNVFFPVYFQTLSKGIASDFIAQIVVEGHTDTAGDYMSNLDLSMRRAQSVVEHCLTMLEGEAQKRLQGMICASGCSYSNPIYNEQGQVDMDRSRRVEVKFTLKDQYMIDEIARIIEN